MLIWLNGTGENYHLTAQHILMELNNVYKKKKLPPHVKNPCDNIA